MYGRIQRNEERKGSIDYRRSSNPNIPLFQNAPPP